MKSANGKVGVGVAMCDGNVRVCDLTRTSTAEDANGCVDECAEFPVVLSTNNEDDVTEMSDDADADMPILACRNSSSSDTESCSDSEPEDAIVEVCRR